MDVVTNLLGNHEDLALLLTGLVTVASALANLFPKATLLGKIVHLLALNLKH